MSEAYGITIANDNSGYVGVAGWKDSHHHHQVTIAVFAALSPRLNPYAVIHLSRDQIKFILTTEIGKIDTLKVWQPSGVNIICLTQVSPDSQNDSCEELNGPTILLSTKEFPLLRGALSSVSYHFGMSLS